MLKSRDDRVPLETKHFFPGTQRACSPEETLERVSRHLGAAGITRIADVTRLDNIGIPVFQAIRPNSRNLTVSQGKGVSPTLAKVSAIMEAIESWHAERLKGASVRASVGSIKRELPYSVYDLPLRKRHLLNDETVLDWFPAIDLRTAKPTVVPKAFVELDYTIHYEWWPPIFSLSSSGLASGNTWNEALVYGLFEILERHSVTVNNELPKTPSRRIRIETIDDQDSMMLIELVRKANADLEIIDATGHAEIPCFEAVIQSYARPGRFMGSGCHFDKGVALCRAIIEAAQARLTAISGTRDDLSLRLYADWGGRPRAAVDGQPSSTVSFRDIPSERLGDDFEQDRLDLVHRVYRLSGVSPLAVDLTRQHINIPVVRIIAPKLRDGAPG